MAGLGGEGPWALGKTGSCPQVGGRRPRPHPPLSPGEPCACGFDTLGSCGTSRGPPRRPPPHVLEQVKGLNQSLRLGHLLCRSRNPDFLLNIIQRQVSPAGVWKEEAGCRRAGGEPSRGVSGLWR